MGIEELLKMFQGGGDGGQGMGQQDSGNRTFNGKTYINEEGRRLAEWESPLGQMLTELTGFGASKMPDYKTLQLPEEGYGQQGFTNPQSIQLPQQQTYDVGPMQQNPMPQSNMPQNNQVSQALEDFTDGGSPIRGLSGPQSGIDAGDTSGMTDSMDMGGMLEGLMGSGGGGGGGGGGGNMEATIERGLQSYIEQSQLAQPRATALMNMARSAPKQQRQIPVDQGLSNPYIQRLINRGM